MRKTALSISLSMIWISISEFYRNSILLHTIWALHYQNLGMSFPEAPVNGLIWGVWSLIFAIIIFILFQKFNFWETFILSWVIGFLMMWLVIGNLGILPLAILPFAIPLSLLEVFITLHIIRFFK